MPTFSLSFCRSSPAETDPSKGPAIALRRLPRQVKSDSKDAEGGDAPGFNPLSAKFRKMTVRSALRMKLDVEMEKKLMLDITGGFDRPLVRGERFICKESSFQSPYFHACVEYSLTALSTHEFAIRMWDRIADSLQPCEAALLWTRVGSCILRSRKSLMHKHKDDVFLGRECLAFIKAYRLFRETDIKKAMEFGTSTSPPPGSAAMAVDFRGQRSLSSFGREDVKEAEEKEIHRTLSALRTESKEALAGSSALSATTTLSAPGTADASTSALAAAGGGYVMDSSYIITQKAAMATAQLWLDKGYIQNVRVAAAFKEDNFYQLSQQMVLSDCESYYMDKLEATRRRHAIEVHRSSVSDTTFSERTMSEERRGDSWIVDSSATDLMPKSATATQWRDSAGLSAVSAALLSTEGGSSKTPKAQRTSGLKKKVVRKKFTVKVVAGAEGRRIETTQLVSVSATSMPTVFQK